MKSPILILVSLLFALNSLADKPKQPYSSGPDMGYEADGLDSWDLPAGQDLKTALDEFTAKCNNTIPTSIRSRFPLNHLDPADFTFKSTIYSIKIPRAGLSYRCYIDVDIVDPTKYHFTKWKASDEFYDIKDPKTGQILKTSYQQCREYIENLDANAGELRVFDRHALLAWAPGNPPALEMCYVTYIQLKDPSQE